MSPDDIRSAEDFATTGDDDRSDFAREYAAPARAHACEYPVRLATGTPDTCGDLADWTVDDADVSWLCDRHCREALDDGYVRKVSEVDR